MRAAAVACSSEAGIVDGDVATLAAVNALLAEGRHDGLLDLRLRAFERCAFRMGLRLRQRLMEIGRLVIFPAAIELVVNHQADPIKTSRLTIANANRITENSSERRHELPVRATEESANDDQNYVHNHKGQEDRVRQYPLPRKPAPNARLAAIDIGKQQ